MAGPLAPDPPPRPRSARGQDEDERPAIGQIRSGGMGRVTPRGKMPRHRPGTRRSAPAEAKLALLHAIELLHGVLDPLDERRRVGMRGSPRHVPSNAPDEDERDQP